MESSKNRMTAHLAHKVDFRMRLMSTVLLGVFVLLTSRGLSYDDGISIMMADNIQSYMSIARSALRFQANHSRSIMLRGSQYPNMALRT